MTMLDNCRTAVMAAMNNEAAKPCFNAGPCLDEPCACADAFVAATIEALMEPTEAMLRAPQSNNGLGPLTAFAMWQAMLKAALEETNKVEGEGT